MATLYELTQQANMLYELLQNEEIDEETFNDTLEAMGTEEKAESYCKLIKQLQNDSNMFSAEISRLAERKRAADNATEKMKHALLNFMTASGQTKLKAGTFAISLSKSQVCNITDENQIPSEFITFTPKFEKAKIKEQLKDGISVPGAELITNYLRRTVTVI